MVLLPDSSNADVSGASRLQLGPPAHVHHSGYMADPPQGIAQFFQVLPLSVAAYAVVWSPSSEQQPNTPLKLGAVEIIVQHNSQVQEVYATGGRAVNSN
jgi:hypothetical protein